MNKKILIVEDEFIIAEDLKLTVEEFGYKNVKTTPSSDLAIELLKYDKPDLVILDIKIEGKMNGLELAKYIKENYDIPVIFCTAYFGKEIEKVRKELKIKMIRKPFLDFLLKETIESEIANSKHNTQQ
jgi:CheY-like chemotaxis protein